MATRVEGEMYYKLDGQLAEIKRQLRQKDGYPYDPDQLSAVLQGCIEGRLPSKEKLINGYFTPIEKQIMRIRELNIQRSWYFTDEDFTLIEQSVPKWPDRELVALTLVPYFPDGADMGGVEYTFQELWQIAASLQHARSRLADYDDAGSDKLRLLKGIEHPAKDEPVLRWEVINLGCNRDRAPIDIRDPDTSPHAGILATAALHPEWVKAMADCEVPYVWIPGYEVNIKSEDPW